MHFGILYIWHHARIVTDEILDALKAPFVVIGPLEAHVVAIGIVARGNFVTFVIFWITFSTLFFARVINFVLW